MALKCEFCGKAPHYGNVISHANNTRRRRWNPNLKRVRAVVAGVKKHVRVCTACIRAGRVKKAAWDSNLEPTSCEPAIRGASNGPLKRTEGRSSLVASRGNSVRCCGWLQPAGAACSGRVGGGERERNQARRNRQVLSHAS